jgi:hypothetical protein
MPDSARALLVCSAAVAHYLLIATIAGRVRGPDWFWLTVFIAGMVAVVYLLYRPSELRRQRLAKGLCLACGYDLRASTGRCPECGQAT